MLTGADDSKTCKDIKYRKHKTRSKWSNTR
jgi:hypothetical protein